MKIKKIALATLLSSAFFVTAANADIQVSSSSKTLLAAGADVCDQFVGTWAGDGYISAKVIFSTISCHYSGGDAGGVTVSKTGSNTYNVALNVNAVSGSSSVCPSNESLNLPATCSGGKINIATAGAKLDGQLSSDARTADLHGTIKIPVPVVGSIDANVDSMHLTKK